MRESLIGPRRRSNASAVNRLNHWWPYDDTTRHDVLDDVRGRNKLSPTSAIRRSQSAMGHVRNAYSEDLTSQVATGASPIYHQQHPPFTREEVPPEYFYPQTRHVDNGFNPVKPEPAYPGQFFDPPNDVPTLMRGPPSPTRSSTASSRGDGSEIMDNPVHWQSQTTQATKVAAAARRKPGTDAKFICEYCGESFTRQYNLKGHLRAHNGQKPYVCEQIGCDKAFARAHDLKRHMSLHTSVSKYQCLACGRCFKRLDALQRHNKSEAGQICYAKLVEQGVYSAPSPKRQVAL